MKNWENELNDALGGTTSPDAAMSKVGAKQVVVQAVQRAFSTMLRVQEQIALAQPGTPAPSVARNVDSSTFEWRGRRIVVRSSSDGSELLVEFGGETRRFTADEIGQEGSSRGDAVLDIGDYVGEQIVRLARS